MKKFFLLVIIALSALIAFPSCNRSASIDAIPEDAFMAIKVNPLPVIRQSGIQDNKKLLRMLKDEMDKDEYKIVKKIFDDPATMGINLKEDIIFTIDGDCALLIVPLSSVKNFVSFLEELDYDVEKGKGGIDYYLGSDDPEEVEGIVLNDMAIWAFGYMEASIEAEELKEMVSGGGKISDPSFSKFAASDEPAALWISAEAIPQKFLREFGRDAAKAVKQLGASSLFASLSLEEGKTDIAIKPYIDENALGVSVKDMYKTGSQKFFKYMPADATVVFNAATSDFHTIYNALPSDDADELKDFLDAMGLKVQDLKKAGGGVTMAINFKKNFWGEPVPQFYIALECDKGLLKKVMDFADIEKDGDVYAIDNEMIAFYSDGAVVIMPADQRDLIESDNLTRDPFRKKVGNCGLYLNCGSPQFKEFFDEALGELYNYEAEAFRSLDIPDLLDYAAIESAPGGEGHGTLYTTKKESLAKTALDLWLAYIEAWRPLYENYMSGWAQEEAAAEEAVEPVDSVVSQILKELE